VPADAGVPADADLSHDTARRPAVEGLIAVLLADPDLAVRRAALSALAQVRVPTTWASGIYSVAIDALADAHLRRPATTGLIAGGGAALPAIRAALEGPTPSREVLIALLRALGKIGGQPAAELLLSRLAHPDDGVRSACLAALRQSRYTAGPSEADFIRRRLQAEIAHAAWLR
jgi:HEAT repeat protein